MSRFRGEESGVHEDLNGARGNMRTGRTNGEEDEEDDEDEEEGEYEEDPRIIGGRGARAARRGWMGRGGGRGSEDPRMPPDRADSGIGSNSSSSSFSWPLHMSRRLAREFPVPHRPPGPPPHRPLIPPTPHPRDCPLSSAKPWLEHQARNDRAAVRPARPPCR